MTDETTAPAPYDWPEEIFDVPQAEWLQLNPGMQKLYDDLRSQLGQLQVQTGNNWIWFVLNGLVATGSETVTTDIWAFLVATFGIDQRDLAAFCHGADGRVLRPSQTYAYQSEE